MNNSKGQAIDVATKMILLTILITLVLAMNEMVRVCHGMDKRAFAIDLLFSYRH